ncbi:MAG: tetratricopeptide repeat protein [Hyphomicrobiales bacterium]|nr:tetratricopeptide repeat protein [Hyphomicrobiales bacterium]
MLALVAAPGAVDAREPVSVARPFEVSDSPAGNYLAALVAGAERDTHAASTFFREALRADPGNSALLERAFVASLANGDMDAAFGLGRDLVKRDPRSGLGNLALGVKALKEKKWQSARSLLARGGDSRQRDLTATLLTAWSYVGQRDGAAAMKTVDRLRDSELASFRDYHAALIADAIGRTDEARKRLERVYEGEKTKLSVADAYARFLSEHGDNAKARDVYLAFDKVVPRHPVVMAALAELAQGKKLEPSVHTADQGAAETLFGLGASGGSAGDELAAIIYLRLSQYLNPENGLTRVSLADVYERMKQYEQAIDVYQAVPQNSPLRVNADIQTGLLLETLDKKDEASKYLASVVADHPGDAEAQIALGNIQRSRKEFLPAIDSYTKALALFGAKDEKARDEKGAWSLYYFRGIAYERAKQWPQAEADFKKALQLYPDQPLVLNYLGYSWVDKGMNLDEAFAMLRKAVDLRPDDGYIVDSLGWAYYKLGKYDDAVRYLERAVDLKPADPTINDHLGDAYWRVGRKLEAHFQWNHARDLKPEPEDLPAILKKIENGMDDKTPSAAEAQDKKNGG